MRRDPRALTAAASSLVRVLSRASVATTSATSSTAIRRVVFPTRDLGFTLASSFFALVAVRSFPAPPGISSVSSRCNRLTVCTRRAESSSRRSTSSRSATSSSSEASTRRSGVRSAVAAIAWASVASVLRALPVSHPRSQLRRNIDDRLPVGEQPLRQRPTHSLRALDRPPVAWPLPPHVAEHPLVITRSSAEPAGRQRHSLLIDGLD